MRCDTCRAWSPPVDVKKLPGESQGAAQRRHVNAGRPLPKGTCHRYPLVAAKDGDDWCLEWKDKTDASKSRDAHTGEPDQQSA